MKKEIENAIWIAIMYGFKKGKEDHTIIDNMPGEEIRDWIWNMANEFEKVYNEDDEDCLGEIDDYAIKVLTDVI